MKKVGAVFLATGLILAAMSLAAAAQSATDSGIKPYVILDGEFWKAMERLSQKDSVTYGDQQVPLLEKIAVASQFMVKTNLTIIKQNERIIHLLEELNRKRLLQER
jgi:ABC-type sugar transport system substrate-binding protein